MADIEYSRFPVYFYDYNEIETFCLSQREQLAQENLGLIVGVLRGGGIPALMLSQMLDVPVDFLHYDRKKAKVEADTRRLRGLMGLCVKEGRKILLVEDVAGAGYTLLNCHAHLLSQLKDESLLRVLTLVRHENSRAKPDYSKDCSAVRAVLPWERYTTGRVFMDEYEKVGQALADDWRHKKILAVDDPAAPLDLKKEWKIDCHLPFDGNFNVTLDVIRAIGPEEIYCNNDTLLGMLVSRLPFIVAYKTINNRRYRISPLD